MLAGPDGAPWPPENFTTQKIPLEVVSERLGHSSIGITADLYTHVLDGMDAEAAAKLDAALKKAGVEG